MANDHKHLIEASRMIDVAIARGYKTTKRGAYIFIYCPLHELQYEGTNHPQQNCYFKEDSNFCICSVCGKSFNTKEFLEEREGISFGEAYDILWDIMGKPSWYKKNNNKPKKELEREKLENQLNQVLQLRISQCEDFLLPSEKKALMDAQRYVLVKRMHQLNKKFGKNLFKEELEKIQ